MKKITVLLVDDHPAFLEGLFTILKLRDEEIQVVGTATNGHEAVERAMELRPDVVLLDIKMPVMDGVTVARTLTEQLPETTLIMLTTFDDRPLISSALEAGAKGYLLKDATVEQIVQAVKHVTRDNVVLSGDLAMKLSVANGDDEIAERPAELPKREYPAFDDDENILGELSERQREVLSLVGRGRSNSEIGKALNLSEKTVRNYMSQIYEILNVHSRTKVALWAMQNITEEG